MTNALKLVSLGGMGNVTQNMFLYEYEDELLIVDCGIGFPDRYMPGVDILIPDTDYLRQQLEQGREIVGMILTHGHDDHIAALPYILPELPEFPIYASQLTAAFAENRMADAKITKKITVVKPREKFSLGQYFSAESVRMTHSVPDTRHYAITTPAGIIYHGSDYKLDHSPIDGQQPDYDFIQELGSRGILCALIDCLRVEREHWIESEAVAGPIIDQHIAETEGKVIVTLMSSHIHRIQQVVNSAIKHGRKVAFIGRSVEQNVEISLQLGKLQIPPKTLISKRELDRYKDHQLCLVVAGAQGQEGSSLMRAVFGEHQDLHIGPTDKVIFSADAIPGNELNYFGAVDELSKNNISVIYPDIEPNIHESGHASAEEQSELVRLLKPEFVMPVGGAERHRRLFVTRVAMPLGYPESAVLLPGNGEILSFGEGQPKSEDTLTLRPRTVDGLGIGDVGPMVLSDRMALGEAGMIVVVIPRSKGQLQLRDQTIVSRGFVFMKEAEEVVAFIKKSVAEITQELGKKAKDDEVKRAVERKLARKLYKVIKREPLIVCVILDI